MADVSKIKIGDNVYNIKDVNTSTKVSKSGDHMTGDLHIDSPNDIRLHDDNKMAGQGGITADSRQGIYFYDFNNTLVSELENVQYANNGIIGLRMGARNIVDGETVYNWLQLRVKPDGTRLISIAEAEPWLDAFGLSDSGWKTLTNASAFTGSIFYRKIGNIGIVEAYQITLASTLTSATGVVLGALPEGYRTSRVVMGYAQFSGSRPPGVIQLAVSTGNISLFKNSNESIPTSINIYFGFTYLL